MKSTTFAVVVAAAMLVPLGSRALAQGGLPPDRAAGQGSDFMVLAGRGSEIGVQVTEGKETGVYRRRNGRHGYYRGSPDPDCRAFSLQE